MKSTTNKEFDDKITSCLDNGILNIDKIIEFKDLELLEYAFDNYSITLEEHIKRLAVQGKYKELFEYSIDNHIDKIHDILIMINQYNSNKLISNINMIASDITKNTCFSHYNNKYKVLEINRKHLIINNNKVNIKGTKDKILTDLKFYITKTNKVGNLTEDYLMDLLNNHNYEILIIKLCAKLEAILKYDYRYTGTFEEMLSLYFDNYVNSYDDEDNSYYSDETIRNNLSNLRLLRNNIVHSSNEKVVDLKLEDLKYCINYICKLNKED